MEQSCGFVLFRQLGKNRYYLLLHYKAGHWDFPKGHVEAGETKKETAIRELEEETTINQVEIIDGFLYEYEYVFGRNGDKSKHVSFMLAKTRQRKVRTSHEHQGARWVTYSTGMKMLTFDNAKKMLRAAEQYLNDEVDPKKEDVEG